MSRSFGRSTLCLLVLLLGMVLGIAADPKPKKSKKPQRKAKAVELVRDAEKGVAFATRAARQAKLDPKAKLTKPLFVGLKQMSLALDGLQKSVASKDASFFNALDAAGKAAGLLRIAAPRVGSTHADVNAGIKTVLNAYELIRANYGREAVRAHHGKDLTDKERQQVAALQEKAQGFLVRLAALEKQAAADARFLRDLQQMHQAAAEVAAAELTLAAYLSALNQIDDLEYEWVAYEHYVPVEFHVSWEETTVVLETLDDTADQFESEIVVEEFAYFEETAEFSAEIDVTVDISDAEVEAEETFVEEQEVALEEDEFIDFPDDCDASIEANETAVDEDDEALDEEDEECFDGEPDDDDDGGGEEPGDDGDDSGGDDSGGDDGGGDDDGGSDESGD